MVKKKKVEERDKETLYETANDALDRLARNKIKTTVENGVIFVQGEPGLHLLGAVDYLRACGNIVRIVQRKKEKSK